MSRGGRFDGILIGGKGKGKVVMVKTSSFVAAAVAPSTLTPPQPPLGQGQAGTTPLTTATATIGLPPGEACGGRGISPGSHPQADGGMHSRSVNMAAMSMLPVTPMVTVDGVVMMGMMSAMAALLVEVSAALMVSMMVVGEVPRGTPMTVTTLMVMALGGGAGSMMRMGMHAVARPGVTRMLEVSLMMVAIAVTRRYRIRMNMAVAVRVATSTSISPAPLAPRGRVLRISRIGRGTPPGGRSDA